MIFNPDENVQAEIMDMVEEGVVVTQVLIYSITMRIPRVSKVSFLDEVILESFLTLPFLIFVVSLPA
jgi:hypothetical protein